ncbi:hypothetical protein [uncultured Lactobacillus sp.]|uniref:hypothetical protein n=1 Tax=uncultured Lactobacillus sp. TaxID=153152 RepID=UPI0026136726|nr:hypothetical protein [uncultured Lactobacillus sp.]
MKIGIWSIIIVILMGIWDLYLAYQRWPKAADKQKASNKNIKPNKTAAKAFLILGVIFTIGGIIALFWH